MLTSSDHVSTLSILFMCVTLAICLGVPIGLAIWAKVRHKKAFSFIPLLFGVLGFFISQIVLRLPILQGVLPLFGWYKQLMQVQWLYVLFLSFTAGLVEEPARFIAFTIMKKRHGFIDGISYGIGHGGIEAIIIIGITYINNIILSIMVNTGSLGSSGSMLPSSLVPALTGTSPYIFLVAGIERIFAISMQIALSLVVLKGFQTNKKALYLTVSIVLHGLANFLALAASQLGVKVMAGSPMMGSVLFAEGFLLVTAVFSVLYIVKQAKNWRKSLQSPTEMPLDTQNITP